MALTRLPGFTLLSTDNFTFANVTVSGNISANYLLGNGSQLTGMYSNTNANGAIDLRVTKSFVDNLQVNANTLNGHSDTYFATSTQGSKADSAVQPGANISVFTNDSGYLVAANLSTYATQSYVGTQITNLINAAPAALDTLSELANALGNDASYSTTITNALSNKLSTSAFTSTADTWLATKTTTNITEGTNLYFTTTRANSAIDARVTKTFIDNLSVVANISNIAYSVAGANVTGIVGNATHATVSDSANSVTGANVTGAVAFATTANSVAGANVSGIVGNATHANLADLANSVAGANVSGAVAYATTANSVAVANVVGIGNIATINKDGNASNILYGNGVFAAAPAGGSGGGATTLDGLTDVTITTPSNNQVLSYDSANSIWINKTVSSGGGGGSSVTVSPTPPSSPTEGDLWLDSNNGEMSVYFGGAWAAIITSVTASNVSFVTDTFTGDGTTSSYVLTATSPLTKEQITVVYDGAVIMKSDYTVAGNTINFTSAPDANSILEITTSKLTNVVLPVGVANTVTDGSQPNITQVGSLVSLESIGTVDFGNSSSLYLPDANLISIPGGQLGQYLTTDGTGNVNWTNLAHVAMTSDTAPVSPGDGAVWLNTLTGELSVYYGGWVIIGGGVSMSIPYFAGANVVGNVNSAIYANYSNFAGIVTTNAQPNITSVGTLTNLTVSGNTVSNTVTSNSYIAAGNGYISNNTFSGTFNDGVVLDYVAGNGRISVGSNDGINFYTNGVANTSILSVSSTGNTSIPNSLTVSGNTQLFNVTANGMSSFTGWLTTQQSTELFVPLTSATGVVSHDLTLGATFYHTNVSGSFTANFVNFPTTDARITVVSLIINQGSTSYLPTVQIDGVAQTVKWLSAATPAASINKIDILTYSMIRSGSTWAVLGQLATYA